MKKLTCRDFGGSCDIEITGNSFEEIGKKCHDHVVEQINRGDKVHQAVAETMKNASQEEQEHLMAQFKKKYNEAADILD